MTTIEVVIYAEIIFMLIMLVGQTMHNYKNIFFSSCRNQRDVGM